MAIAVVKTYPNWVLVKVIVGAAKKRPEEPKRAGLLLASSWFSEESIRETGKSGPTAGKFKVR